MTRKSPRSLDLGPALARERRAMVVAMVERLPEGRVAAHGAHLSLEVRKKRFGWLLEDHHGDGRLSINCKASRETWETLSREARSAFHVPKYLGHRGWVGLWLDLPDVDRPRVEATLLEAYRATAPKALLARLETPRTGGLGR